MVTAVIGDFTGSFTSLASFFGDDFIIRSPRPLGGGGERRGWAECRAPRWGSKL